MFILDVEKMLGGSNSQQLIEIYKEYGAGDSTMIEKLMGKSGISRKEAEEELLKQS